jgi:hypothetical protein
VSLGSWLDHATSGLIDVFDRSIFFRDRTRAQGEDYLVVSSRQTLMSQDAFAFVVLHHLSNMVRYRPQHVEALRGGRYFWLFSSWVDRGAENFLLGVASRLCKEEHSIGSKRPA